MKMNKDSIKIKYLIGSYRDELDFPTIEDFEHLIKNWYLFEGGHHFIHTYRGIPEIGKIIFPENILKEKLGVTEEIFIDLLRNLIDNKFISINKETKFSAYYQIN